MKYFTLLAPALFSAALLGCLPEDGPFDSDAVWINCSSLTEIDCSLAPVRYVDGSADEGGDGTNWAAAFNSLQEGINHAHCTYEECGTPIQVWTAAGNYHVFRENEDNTLRIRKKTLIYGGFSNAKTALDDRDPETNRTRINGDNNVCHVVTGDNNSTIDGFTITTGMAVDAHETNPSHCSAGGGMFIYQVDPVVNNCTFSENVATFGAGLYAHESSAVITNCSFIGNWAYQDGGGLGSFAGSITVSDCLISNNIADNEGGGMGNSDGASPQLDACIFEDNQALHGGGMGNRAASPQLTNCIFTGNTADLGAAMGNELGASPSITNCTFVGNQADTGGGAIGNEAANPTIYNSIFWDNSPEQVASDLASEVYVGYSLVEDGDPLFADTEFIVDANPQFVDGDGGNFMLDEGSPCIDAADGVSAPELDFAGNSRVDDPETDNTGEGPPWADIGAYEYQI